MQSRASSCQGGGFSYGTKVLGLGSAAAEAAALAAAAERQAARQAALAQQSKSQAEAFRRSLAASQEAEWRKAAPEGRAVECRLCALVNTGSDLEKLIAELQKASVDDANYNSGDEEEEEQGRDGEVCSFRRLALVDSKEAALVYPQTAQTSPSTELLLEIYEAPSHLVGGATAKTLQRFDECASDATTAVPQDETGASLPEAFLVCETSISPNAERLFEALEWKVRTKESVSQRSFRLAVEGSFVEARISWRYLDELRSKEVFPGRVLFELVAAETTDASLNSQQRNEQRTRLREQTKQLRQRLKRAASAFDGSMQFSSPSVFGLSA